MIQAHFSLNKQSKILADGAMGTLLLGSEESFATGVMKLREKPGEIVDAHKRYIEAGAKLIQTHTFSCNRLALARYQLEDRFEEFNTQAISLAQKARSGLPAWIAGNIGASGISAAQFALHSKDVAESIHDQMDLFCSHKLDAISFETLTHMHELKLVLGICTQNNYQNMPILISVSPRDDLSLYDGTEFSTWSKLLEISGIAAFGINCVHNTALIQRFLLATATSTKPLILRPNAGLPIQKSKNWIYPVDCDSFYGQLEQTCAERVNLLGGCCGTTPEYTKKLNQLFFQKSQ